MLLNQQLYIKGYISIMRGVFLMSSVGIALISLSNNFIKYKKLFVLLSTIIIIYSIIYGTIAGINSYEYINIIKKEKNLPELYSAVLKNSDKWIKLSYVYMGLILIISTIIFFNN